MENLGIPGSASLGDQETTIRFREAKYRLELVTYKKMDTGSSNEKFNEATFIKLDLGTPILKLHLAEVPAGGDVVSLIRENLAKKRKIVFQEELFVSSKITRVIGFRDLA